MKKTDKNIIEAGITPEEFYELFDGELPLEDYLSKYTLQAIRYYHLSDLAFIRGENDLADYFAKKRGSYKSMKKTDKNIIEAGITPKEFYRLFDDEFPMEEYLSEYTSQSERYRHLRYLAIDRGEYTLAAYFSRKSGINYVDYCY